MGARANDKRKTAKRGEKGTSRRAQPAAQGQKSSKVLFLMGIGAVLFGLCLAILPRYVPQVDWYSVVLDRIGVTSSPVVLGGLVLLLISFMTRVLGIVAGTGGATATKASDELHGDIGELQDVVRKIHVEVLQLKSSQASTMEAVGAMRSENRDSQENGSGLNEEMKSALFRVAASVDQMGARIDGLLTQRFADLKDTLEELRAGVLSNRTELETGLRAFEQRLAGQPGRFSNHVAPTPTPAHATETAPIALETPAPAAPATTDPLTDLGVLDEIEDFASRDHSALGELGAAGELAGLASGEAPAAPTPQPDQQPAQDPHSQNVHQSFDW